jgi:hypothetical protein
LKLIHVSSEDDYGALDFNNLKISHKEAYEKAFHSENGIWEFRPNGWVTAYDFPKIKVDREFISLIRMILEDPNRLNSEDFHIIEF